MTRVNHFIVWSKRRLGPGNLISFPYRQSSWKTPDQWEVDPIRYRNLEGEDVDLSHLPGLSVFTVNENTPTSDRQPFRKSLRSVP